MAACLVHASQAGGRPLLFWNTFNSAPFRQSYDLDTLPSALRRALTEL